MPKRTDINTILIIGAGPIVIGRHANLIIRVRRHKVLREEGYKVVLWIPTATIMTDPNMADVTYIEPIQWQTVEKIIEKENVRTRFCQPWADKLRWIVRWIYPKNGVLKI